MKRLQPLLFLPAGALLLFAACDRPKGDAQRTADEQRIAELKDLEAKAAQRDQAAQTASLAQQQQSLADQQQSLADQQAKLDADTRRLQEQKEAVAADAEKQKRWQEEDRRVAEERRALQAERDRLARAPQEPPQGRAIRTSTGGDRQLDTFYTALDPMGDWLQVEPYGYCWQPREASDPGWRPYTDGTWVYTDYGWTWKGNEPFGWATYHYGRWTKVRHVGWVWVPGSEWAPAWVSWRRNAQYVGWAPLPPEAHSGSGFNGAVDSYYDIGPASYNFVPASRLGEATYRGVVVEPAQNVEIVNQTTNVTNITYNRVENRTVVMNQGPDFGQINAVSARAVPRMTLQRETELPGRNGGLATVAGGVLRMAAPMFASAPRAASAPVRVKETVKAPEVEHGWGGVAPAAMQAARTQQRQEAARAEHPERPAAPSARPAPPAMPSAPGPAPEVTRAEAPATTPRPAAPPAARPSTPAAVPKRPMATPSPASEATPPEPRRPRTTPAPLAAEPATPAPEARRPRTTPVPPAAEPGTPPARPLRPGGTPTSPNAVATPATPPHRPGRPPATPAAATAEPTAGATPAADGKARKRRPGEDPKATPAPRD